MLPALNTIAVTPWPVSEITLVFLICSAIISDAGRYSSLVEHQLPKLRRRVRFPSPASLKPRSYAVFVFSGIHLRIHGVLAGAHCLDGLCKELIQLPSQAFGTGADDVAGAACSKFFILEFFL